MNRLMDELKNNGLITAEAIEVIQHENSIINSLHIEFIQSLEANNQEKKSMYIEMVAQEEKKLKKIKSILQDSRFKRAYKNPENIKKIDNLLNYILKPTIQVTKGSKVLDEIYNEMVIILEQQIVDEKAKLNDIRKEVGNVIWDELKDEFEKEKFLNYFI